MKNPLTIVTTLVLLAVGTAGAGTRRKVEVETEPAGAVVYLDAKQAGPACRATPCTIYAPVGESTLIVEMKDHASRYELLVVPARGRVPKVSFQLALTLGVIVIDGPAGAVVTVDHRDLGAVPARAVASQDAHHVVVTLAGTSVYDQYVDVIGGNTTTVTLSLAAPSRDHVIERAAAPEPSVTRSVAPRVVHARLVQARAAMDIGFRHVAYSGVDTPQRVRAESENGQILAGTIVELWPGELAGLRSLRGISVLARLQLGVNSEAVMGNGLVDKARTSWRSTELSLRNAWTVGRRFSLEVGAGYVRDRYQFAGAPQDLMLVPDVDYQSLRIGGRGSIRVWKLEPYAAIEDRIVMSGGKLAARFARGDASGIRGAVGADLRVGSITARVEGSLTRYSWNLTADPTSEYRATGATDTIRQLQLAVGYEY